MKTTPYTPYINLPRRCAAVFIDLLLATFLFTLIAWLLMLEYPDAEALTNSVAKLLVLLIAPAILVLWWSLQGSPGKLLLGCRIVDARSGANPQAWQVVVRMLGYSVSILPLGLGVFWMLWDRRRQTWHDKLARTVVVEDDDSRLNLQQLADTK